MEARDCQSSVNNSEKKKTKSLGIKLHDRELANVIIYRFLFFFFFFLFSFFVPELSALARTL